MCVCLSIVIPNIWNHQLDYHKVSWKLVGKQVAICTLHKQGEQISSCSLHTLVATMRREDAHPQKLLCLGTLTRSLQLYHLQCYTIFGQQGSCQIRFLISEVPPNNPLQSVMDMYYSSPQEGNWHLLSFFGGCCSAFDSVYCECRLSHVFGYAKNHQKLTPESWQNWCSWTLLLKINSCENAGVNNSELRGQ